MLCQVYAVDLHYTRRRACTKKLGREITSALYRGITRGIPLYTYTNYVKLCTTKEHLMKTITTCCWCYHLLGEHQGNLYIVAIWCVWEARTAHNTMLIQMPACRAVETITPRWLSYLLILYISIFFASWVSRMVANYSFSYTLCFYKNCMHNTVTTVQLDQSFCWHECTL